MAKKTEEDKTAVFKKNEDKKETDVRLIRSFHSDLNTIEHVFSGLKTLNTEIRRCLPISVA